MVLLFGNLSSVPVLDLSPILPSSIAFVLRSGGKPWSLLLDRHRYNSFHFLVQLGEVTNKQKTEQEYRTIKFYISSTDINPKINIHV